MKERIWVFPSSQVKWLPIILWFGQFAFRPASAQTNAPEFQFEGTVTFVTEQSNGLELEVKSRTDRMNVTVADASGLCPELLLNGKIRVEGVCQNAFTIDEQTIPSDVFVHDCNGIQLLEAAAKVWEAYPLMSIKEAAQTNFAGKVVHLAGRLAAIKSGRSLIVDDDTGQIEISAMRLPAATSGDHIEVLGKWKRSGTNVALQWGVCRNLPVGEVGDVKSLPVLVSVEQVKRLKRGEAESGYPVILRGVVTSVRPDFHAGVLQDSTRGIYISRWVTNGAMPPCKGEYWEIEGTTDPGDFAPLVRAKRATRLGKGRLPEPLHPALDQLVNGSLDTEYVEVQGIVTDSRTNQITLLIRGGALMVDLPNLQPDVLKRYENALVRLRGCLFANWDRQTHQVMVGVVTFFDPAINVDEPAPANPFGGSLKGVGELRLFDPEANIFQRVKVCGQIVYRNQRDCYLINGASGLRFITRKEEDLQAGDFAEIAGFPDLGGASPILREASVRKNGHDDLPKPHLLGPADFLKGDYDSTLVHVEALLVNIKGNQDEQVLELQSGLRTFLARFCGASDRVRSMLPGSRLALTGVYVISDARRPGSQSLSSFELLVNSASDINVLSRPPWWTVRRVLQVLELMAIALVAGLLWVFTLKRRVNVQTGVIRRHIERQATLEERTRIARELHDTLEQALAGVGMQLNALADMLIGVTAEGRRILEVARAMVRHSQEEARRSVRNLRTFALDQSDLSAALFKMGALIRNSFPGKVEVQVVGESRRLPIGIETHLLRIGQEAFNNAIKHANAKIIRLELEFADSLVRLTITDDGCGFNTGLTYDSGEHFGLLGIKERAEKIGGTLLVQSNPGAGTKIKFTLPVKDSTTNFNVIDEGKDKNPDRG